MTTKLIMMMIVIKMMIAAAGANNNYNGKTTKQRLFLLCFHWTMLANMPRPLTTPYEVCIVFFIIIIIVIILSCLQRLSARCYHP